MIATGEQHSVREFCQVAFAELGIELRWKGKGVSEQEQMFRCDEEPLAMNDLILTPLVQRKR